jgi:predicted nucleotidyltransferase
MTLDLGAYSAWHSGRHRRVSRAMKTSLDHLPDAKRRELAHVVRVLMEEFESEIEGATQLWKKRGRVVKVILYGSYARGDWVDDPVCGYKSDYDILVVVNDPRLTDPVEYWSRADDRLVRDATVTNSVSAPVNFIVHDFGDVNSQLAQGRPFFVDIVKQGIALYEAEGFPLTQSRTLPPRRRKQRRRSISTSGFRARSGAWIWRKRPWGRGISKKPRSIFIKLQNDSITAFC